MSPTTTHELRMAEEIVSALPAGSFVRVCSDERDVIRYAVRAPELKLKSVILGRSSLRRLMQDPAGAVKVEYLQREVREAALRRIEFRYPSRLRRATTTSQERVARVSVS